MATSMNDNSNTEAGICRWRPPLLREAGGRKILDFDNNDASPDVANKSGNGSSKSGVSTTGGVGSNTASASGNYNYHYEQAVQKLREMQRCLDRTSRYSVSGSRTDPGFGLLMEQTSDIFEAMAGMWAANGQNETTIGNLRQKLVQSTKELSSACRQCDELTENKMQLHEKLERELHKERLGFATAVANAGRRRDKEISEWKHKYRRLGKRYRQLKRKEGGEVDSEEKGSARHDNNNNTPCDAEEVEDVCKRKANELEKKCRELECELKEKDGIIKLLKFRRAQTKDDEVHGVAVTADTTRKESTSDSTGTSTTSGISLDITFTFDKDRYQSKRLHEAAVKDKASSSTYSDKEEAIAIYGKSDTGYHEPNSEEHVGNGDESSNEEGELSNPNEIRAHALELLQWADKTAEDRSNSNSKEEEGSSSASSQSDLQHRQGVGTQMILSDKQFSSSTLSIPKIIGLTQHSSPPISIISNHEHHNHESHITIIEDLRTENDALHAFVEEANSMNDKMAERFAQVYEKSVHEYKIKLSMTKVELDRATKEKKEVSDALSTLKGEAEGLRNALLAEEEGFITLYNDEEAAKMEEFYERKLQSLVLENEEAYHTCQVLQQEIDTFRQKAAEVRYSGRLDDDDDGHFVDDDCSSNCPSDCGEESVEEADDADELANFMKYKASDKCFISDYLTDIIEETDESDDESSNRPSCIVEWSSAKDNEFAQDVMTKVYSDFEVRRAKDKVSQRDVSEPQRAETPDGEQKPPARAAASNAVEDSKRRPEPQGYYVTNDSVLSQSCTYGNSQLSNFKIVSKTAVADEAAGNSDASSNTAKIKKDRVWFVDEEDEQDLAMDLLSLTYTKLSHRHITET